MSRFFMCPTFHIQSRWIYPTGGDWGKEFGLIYFYHTKCTIFINKPNEDKQINKQLN